ncbi:hypothetical protein FI667_g4469, partial [Globisporangium splendens]
MKALFSSSRSSETDTSSTRSSQSGRSSRSSSTSTPQQLPTDADGADVHGDALAFAATFLSDPQKRGLVGLCACLLPRVHDGSRERQWSTTYLALLVVHFLALPRTQADAYVPMLTATDHYGDIVDGDSDGKGGMDPAPFLELLVPPAAPVAASSGGGGFKALFKKKLKKEKQEDNEAALSSPMSPSMATKDAFRLKLLQSQLWFTVKAIGYDARARTLLRQLADVMEIPWSAITTEEVLIGRTLFAEAIAMPLEKRPAKPSIWDWKRNAAIGAAAVTGGALLAITGGLAAPAIAASLTALGGAGVAIGTAVGSTAGVTAATILFGTAGAGVVGMKTDTRTRGVHEFHFDLVSSGDGMNVYICISGWMEDDDPKGANGFRRSWGDSREYLRAFYRSHNPEKVDQVDQVLERYKGREDEFFGILRRTYSIHDGTTTQDPLRMLAESRAATYGSAGSETNTPDAMRAWRWKDRFQQGDQYVLMWEEALLRKFGRSMRSFAREQVMTYANAEIVKYTALAALFAAVAIPRTILRLADMIDNVWVLAMNAADASGKLLAQSLQRREQGLRPVTLVGYGMGARLIFACLKELAKTPEECCGIVENAVLLGSPVPVVNQDWQNARRVVSGRLINGYSENDWMLGVMYRYQGWALNSAGIAAIDVRGVENVNLSSIINGHMEYKNKIGVIMDVVNLD